MKNIDLSIITVNWNTKELLLNCIGSAYQTIKRCSFEYIVVDNGSADGSTEALRSQYPDVILIENTLNTGSTRANNQGLSRGRGRYLMMLNSDTVLTEEAVDRLVEFMESHPEAGAAGGQLLNRDGSRQNSFDSFPTLLTELTNKSLLKILFPQRYLHKTTKFDKPVEVDQVISACVIMRREVIAQVGLLDERFFLFFEETDWALRIREAGWRIFHVPSARIYHLQGQSAKQKLALARIEFFRSRYQYFGKHFGKNRYRLLYFGLTIKLAVNLFINLIGMAATMGISRSIGRKVYVYSHLLWWHLMGCPKHTGLNPCHQVRDDIFKVQNDRGRGLSE